MKSALIRLKEYSLEVSGVEKELVSYLLSKPQSAVGCSIHVLAQTTRCSAATIIRLCKKIGFSGYKEMQRALIQDITLESENKYNRLEEIGHGDSFEQLVSKVTSKNIESLENTRKLLDIQSLKKCVALLEQCNTLHLFGMGSSLLVAHDAYLKFLRINKSCVVSDDWHAQLLQAMNIRKDDLAIILSYSGGTDEMLICADEIKKRGAPVIAITRFDESPLARMADINLSVASSELLLRTGAMASRISQLNVIDILYVAYINQNYEESIEQLKRTSIHKISGKGD